MQPRKLNILFVTFIHRHHEEYFRIPLLAIANSDGLYLYIYSQKKKQFISKNFEKLKNNVHSLDSCPNGKFLFLGLVTGQILIYQISHVETSPNTAEFFFVVSVPEEFECWNFSLIDVPFQSNMGSFLPQFLPCPAMIKSSPLFPVGHDDYVAYQPIEPPNTHEKEMVCDREDFFNLKSQVNKDTNSSIMYEIKKPQATKAEQNTRKISNIGVQKEEITPLDDDSNGVFETKSERDSERFYDLDDSVFFKKDFLGKNEKNHENSIDEGKCLLQKEKDSDMGDISCASYCTFAVAWSDGRVCLCSLMVTSTSGCESRGEYDLGGEQYSEKDMLHCEVDPAERHNKIGNKKKTFYVDEQRETENQKKREKQRVVTYGWAATHFFQTNETFCKVDFFTDYFKFSNETDFRALCLVVCSQSGRYFFLEASSGSGGKDVYGVKNLPPPKNVFFYNTEIFLNPTGHSEDEGFGDSNTSTKFACGK